MRLLKQGTDNTRKMLVGLKKKSGEEGGRESRKEREWREGRERKEGVVRMLVGRGLRREKE